MNWGSVKVQGSKGQRWGEALPARGKQREQGQAARANHACTWPRHRALGRVSSWATYGQPADGQPAAPRKSGIHLVGPIGLTSLRQLLFIIARLNFHIESNPVKEHRPGSKVKPTF